MPSDEVGGDFYYVDEIEFHRKKNYITILADVSGHGVGASMLTVLVKDVYTDFRINFEDNENLKLSDFILMLNKKIINLNMQGSRFVTIFILMLDLSAGKLRYSSAGHPHSVLLRENSEIETFGIKKAPPAGIIADYDYIEEEIDIRIKDKIFIYSDGILDIFSYETENFYNFLLSNRELDIKKMRREIEKTIQLKKDEEKKSREKLVKIDDITMVLAELL
jgi:sigma-B regulation protein RsbU (phosphoserine phosphatase)